MCIVKILSVLRQWRTPRSIKRIPTLTGIQGKWPHVSIFTGYFVATIYIAFVNETLFQKRFVFRKAFRYISIISFLWVFYRRGQAM